MGILDTLVDWVARAMDAAGLNGTRLRWKWNRRRQAMREGGVRASVAFRAARGKHKMCPSCRALVIRTAGRCPECGATLAGVRAPGVSRMLSNILPGATMTTSLILLANGFWFVLMMMTVIRETDSSGFLSMLIFPRGSGEILIRFGALYSETFNGLGDWWRLIPPIFLHGGLLHFFFNSFVFLQLAPIVEQEYGTERFFLAYLVSGIFGFLLSQAWVIVTGGFRLTLGASGAVLGLMGLLIAYGIRRPADPKQHAPLRGLHLRHLARDGRQHRPHRPRRRAGRRIPDRHDHAGGALPHPQAGGAVAHPRCAGCIPGAVLVLPRGPHGDRGVGERAA